MKPMLKEFAEYRMDTTDHYREEGFNFFNYNILKLAYDESEPILERINYVNIVLNNYLEHFGRNMSSVSSWSQVEIINRFVDITKDINDAFMSIDTSCLTNFHINMPDLYDDSKSIKDLPVIVNGNAIKYIRKNDLDGLLIDGIKYVPISYIRDFSVDYEISEVGIWSKEYIEDAAFQMDRTYIKLAVLWVNQNLSPTDLNKLRKYALDNGFYVVFANVDLLNCVNYRPSEDQSYLKYTPFTQRREHIDYMNQKNFCKVVRVPKDSFDNVIDLYDQAIHNDAVESIYMTIYRTKVNMRLMDTLIEGTRLGKKLNIYIELTAKGDEQNNVDLVNRLLAECNLDNLNLYTSFSGYKIHAKIGLVAFKDGRFICHCGTGNFNEVTAKIYKDTHIISDDPKLVKEVFQSFKSIATKNPKGRFKLKKILKKEIRKEIQKGKSGRIILKCNHIADSEIIDLLVLARHRGCDVRVFPRSTFGYSEKELGEWKFRGGRFLEHERIYIFGKGKPARVYMSSSDILFRNLYKRMEFTFKLPSSVDAKQFVKE